MHKQECKSISASIPISAEVIRGKSLPDLVEFIWSPGVLVADAAKQAARSVLRRHDKKPLSKALSSRVIAGFMDVVERLYEERIDAVAAPCEAIYRLLENDFVQLFLDEGWVSIVVRALRVALDTPRRTAALTADGGASGVHARFVTGRGGGAACTLDPPSKGSSSRTDTSEAYSAAAWLLYTVEFLVDSSDDRVIGRLVIDGALPVVVTALHKCSSDWQGLDTLQEICDSICEVISAVAVVHHTNKLTLVAAGVVPALLSAILESGIAAPTSAFIALSHILTPPLALEAPALAEALAEAVCRDLTRIVDVVFYALAIELIDFDKEDEDDVAALVHAGRLILVVMFHIRKHGRTVASGGVVSSPYEAIAALFYGEDEPDRLPVLVNALRASTHGIADNDYSAVTAYAFATAITFAIESAGWASCRAAVEAGAIPALLTSLRKLGDSSVSLASAASTALRTLQLSGREGCCSERIATELSMRGTTQKLLRRLRDVWRSKAAAAAAAAVDSATHHNEAEETNTERAVTMLSALLADMTGHA